MAEFMQKVKEHKWNEEENRYGSFATTSTLSNLSIVPPSF